MKNNPFNPNSVVKPHLFAGRSKSIHQVIRKLSQVRNKLTSSFVISGERGIGKTALANHIMHIAQKRDKGLENLHFLTTYYTVEKDQAFHSVLQSSLNLLTDQLPKSVINRLSTRLGQFFKGGKFSFEAFEAFDVKLETKQQTKNTSPAEDDIYLKDQAISILTNILKGMEEDSPGKGKKAQDGILIVLDEIHNIKNIQGVAQILRNVITTLDMNGYGNISFLIITHPSAVKRFFDGDPSARRTFDVLFLDVMPDNEAKEILTKGFDKVQIKYNNQIIDKQIAESGGYPHAIQVLGHNLIEVDTDHYIDKKDWTKAIIKTAIELQRKDFSNLYHFNGRSRQRDEILNILAMLPRPVCKTDLAKAFKKNIYTSSCLPELKKTGAIKEEPETGKISLQSYLFKSAIRMHIASQPATAVKSTLWFKAANQLK